VRALGPGRRLRPAAGQDRTRCPPPACGGALLRTSRLQVGCAAGPRWAVASHFRQRGSRARKLSAAAGPGDSAWAAEGVSGRGSGRRTAGLSGAAGPGGRCGRVPPRGRVLGRVGLAGDMSCAASCALGSEEPLASRGSLGETLLLGIRHLLGIRFCSVSDICSVSASARYPSRNRARLNTPCAHLVRPGPSDSHWQGGPAGSCPRCVGCGCPAARWRRGPARRGCRIHDPVTGGGRCRSESRTRNLTSELAIRVR
jgi:hypothetical protein